MKEIAIHVSSNLYKSRCVELEKENIECMWIQLKPRLILRTVWSLVIGLFYQTPLANEKELCQEAIDYFISTIDAVKMKSPQDGIILCGDFKQRSIKSVVSCHPDIKQLVMENTNRKATLDLIIMNLDTNYSAPRVLAPVGSSDHCTVLMVRLVKKGNRVGRCVTKEEREALDQCMAIRDWSPVKLSILRKFEMEIFNTHIQTALQTRLPQQRKAETHMTNLG